MLWLLLLWFVSKQAYWQSNDFGLGCTVMIKEVKIKQKRILTWKFGIVCLAIASIMAILFICSVFIVDAIKGIDIDDYSVDTVNISSGDEFVTEIIKNSKLGSISGNKKYYLTEDIVLSAENVNTLKQAGEITFFGILDGYDANRADGAGKNQCYKISFSSDAPSMNKPIFNVISEQAQILNLTIESSEFVGEIGKTIAVLSNINHGMLQNINLKDTTIDISNNPIAAAALTVYNYGDISYCVADVKFKVAQEYISSDVGKSGNWQCVVGAIAANNSNEGKISNVIASVDYPSDFLVLSRQYYRNQNVGYVVGTWSDSDELSNLFVLYDFEKSNAEIFILTAHDFADLDRNILMLYANGGENGGNMTESNFHGWERWVFFDNNSLPKLVDGFNQGDNIL